MGIQSSRISQQTTPTLIQHSDNSIKKAILRSHHYIQNCSWIFDLEEKLVNYIIITSDKYYDAKNHVHDIFSALSLSQDPFFIFDVPFQENFQDSIYPIDVILGLYSSHHQNVKIQLCVSDIFVGEYHLPPHTIVPLKRFLLRFLFYGSLLKIKCQDMNSYAGIKLICCILDNHVRKNWVVHSYRE